MLEPSHCYLFWKPTMENIHFLLYFMFLNWVNTEDLLKGSKAFLWFLVMPSQAYVLDIQHSHFNRNTMQLMLMLSWPWCCYLLVLTQAFLKAIYYASRIFHIKPLDTHHGGKFQSYIFSLLSMTISHVY